MNYYYIILLMIMLISPLSAATRYGELLCNEPEYFCIKIHTGESWTSLFPNPESRDLVRRINRMNVRLQAGMTIAVPKNLDRITIYDVSPFPRYIEADGEKTIYVSQKKISLGSL